MGNRLYGVVDRAFWLIWIAFPLVIWRLVAEIRAGAGGIEGLSQAQRACLDILPQISRFGPAGQSAFWALFGFEFAVYALLLGLAHWVVHRCATGRVLVAEMIGVLRAIGVVITVFPLVNLVLSNAALLIWVRTGDMPSYTPDLALDLPVLGFGLLMLTIAAAMRQAVALRQEADLTI